MRKSLLALLLIVFSLSLHAQKDTLGIAAALPVRDAIRDASGISVSIYPVPVRENNFTVKTDRNISFIKITNVIGQDIMRIQYNNPEQMVRILLDNPKRGIYIVTILFTDGARVVKKIMVEQME